MSTLRTLLHRLLALLHGGRLDRELDDEIQAHLELLERDALLTGLPPDQARIEARRRFGGVDVVKEAHRDRRSVRWIDDALRDMRYGLRILTRQPGFALVTVGVLALGIGANAAMFSLVDAVLLKPLPFAGYERIARVWEAPRPGATNHTSTPDFLDWKRLASSFEFLAAEQGISAALTGPGEPRRLPGKAVTSEYFGVFATRAALGRTFAPDDDARNPRAVVLSHAAWRTHFGGDPAILDRRPVLDGEPHQVVGVLPPGAFDRDAAQFWKLLVLPPGRDPRNYHWLIVYGRLREGMSVAQGRAEMQTIDAALTDVTPGFKRDWTIEVEALEKLLVGNALRRSMLVTFGAVALVLLIACANVANLLLARGAARRKELAVRASLGASRRRLVMQLLTESGVLCALGGAAGLLVASLLIPAARPALAGSLPFTADVALDLRVLAFTAIVALGVTLAIGILPALQTSLGALAREMNDASRGSSGARLRLRRGIVIGEVALSLVLLCGALLLMRSLVNLQQLDTGIRSENVITMSADLPLQAYPTPERAAAFYWSLAERLEAVPGIARVALTSHLPLQWIGNGEGLRIRGVEEVVNVRFKRVDDGYFDALGIPVLAGRGITSRDRETSPRVVVINEALAARLAEIAGMRNPLGERVQVGYPSYAARGASYGEVEIVGLIRSERVNGPGRPDPPVVYVPIAQAPRLDFRILARTHLDPAAAMPAIRAAVHELDPNLPLGDVATMEQVRDRTLLPFSQPARMLGLFAAVATILAALGLYGVLAQSVTERRREIGIRMALGARLQDVRAHVLKTAAALIAGGLALGLAGSLALTRVLESLLFEVSTLDPLAFVVAGLGIAVTGLVASLVPASRAASVDPVTVLRNEG